MAIQGTRPVLTEAEKLAQIVAFATIEAIEAGYLDRFLHRLIGACKMREGVMPPRRIGALKGPE